MNIKHIFFGALLAGLSSGASAAISLTDDIYEPNDTMATAFDLSTYAGITISAVELDDSDWYMIYVTPGQNRVQVDLRHLDAEADIDVELYDAAGVVLFNASSTTDNEFIEFDVDPAGGTYYIFVDTFGTGTSIGATYTLLWDAIAPLTEDNYESNNTPATAYNLSFLEATWLSDIFGSGISNDVDWYTIDVTAGWTQVIIDATFLHADADIDIRLYDATGTNLLASSTSITDNERINFNVGAAGTYKIEVRTSGTYNNATYDLWWDDVPVPVAADSGSFGLISLLFLPLLTVLRRKVRV